MVEGAVQAVSICWSLCHCAGLFFAPNKGLSWFVLYCCNEHHGQKQRGELGEEFIASHSLQSMMGSRQEPGDRS